MLRGKWRHQVLSNMVSRYDPASTLDWKSLLRSEKLRMKLEELHDLMLAAPTL
jgi:hypothetical protein